MVPSRVSVPLTGKYQEGGQGGRSAGSALEDGHGHESAVWCSPRCSAGASPAEAASHTGRGRCMEGIMGLSIIPSS